MAGLLVAAFHSHGAGLGKLTVHSVIGQPLNAEVAIAASAEELASMSAKLAPHEAFKEAGIEFTPVLAGLRFAIAKQPDGQSVLKLTSERPLNEPFLHFLVEINWSSGRMTREYTFLLDPPELLQATRPVPAVAPVAAPVAPSPAPAAQPLPAPTEPQARPATPPPAAPPSVPPAPAAAENAQVRVKSGDTLGKIAAAHKPDSVTLDQMLVALFNDNREVFDGGNMNRLRAGKILRIPAPDAATGIDTGEARKLVIAQASDFNVYRRRLAEATHRMPAAEPPRGERQASGRIQPQVEEKAPAPVKDKLEVSRTETPATKTAAVAGGKNALEEDLIARDKALREASGRIAELEKNLDNLKKLVELKNQAAAQAQQQAQAVARKPAETKQSEPTPLAKAAEPPAPVPVGKPAETAKPEPVPTGKAATEAAPAPVAVTREEEKPAEKSEAPAAPASEPPAPAPAAKRPAPPPPAPEPGFVEENPELVVFGGGGLLAALLGYLGFSAWRRKKQAAAAQDTVTDEPALPASAQPPASGAIFGATSENVDHNEVSIQGDFSESGALTTEESVDPVAEADVYIAYGRDAQAEAILLAGLKNDAKRTAIHLKLLEIHARRKSVEPFEKQAADLHALTHGQGADWDKAVQLALALGLTTGLFAGAAMAAGAPAGTMETIDSEPELPPAADPVQEAAAATLIARSVDLAQPAMLPVAEESAGSLDFDLDLGTTSVPARVEPIAAPTEPAQEAASLDFDFDLGTSEEPPAPADIPDTPTPAEVVADSNSVDFSLDLGSLPEAPVAAPIGAQEEPAAGNEMDFDFDLGASPLADEASTPTPEPLAADAAMAEVPATEAPDLSADVLNDLKLDFDLELDAAASVDPLEGLDLDALADLGLDDAVATTASPKDLPSVSAAPAADAANAGDDDLDLLADLAMTDFDLPQDQAAMPAPQPDAAVEEEFALPKAEVGRPAAPEALTSLPDIDLEAPVPSVEADAPPAPAVEDDEPDNPEVATKLELAQAYEEMGDRDGARELLNEVLSEGSRSQQAQARARLEQLDI